MAMQRPFPEPNITSITGLWDYANTVTNEWMSVVFMIMVTGVIFVVMKWQGRETSDSFMVGFGTASFLGVLLWAAELMPFKILGLWFAFAVIGVLWSAIDR